MSLVEAEPQPRRGGGQDPQGRPRPAARGERNGARRPVPAAGPPATAAIILVAINPRPGIVSVGPVLPAIMLVGGALTLGMTLPLDEAFNVARNALNLAVGHLVAADGNLLAGHLRDLDGNVRAAMWILVAVAAGIPTACPFLQPLRRHVAARGARW